MANRRIFPRLDESWVVRYRAFEAPPKRRLSGDAMTVNISGGGICFRCDQSLTEDDLIVFEMDSSAAKVPMQGVARVAWAGRDEKGPIHGASFIWINESPPGRRLLAEFVDSHRRSRD